MISFNPVSERKSEDAEAPRAYATSTTKLAHAWGKLLPTLVLAYPTPGWMFSVYLVLSSLRKPDTSTLY